MSIQDNDEKKKAIAISVTLQPDFLKEIKEAAASLRTKRVALLTPLCVLAQI